MKTLTAIELAEELFKIHSHAKLEGSDKEQVVYKEADIIALLVKLGYPGPDWAGHAREVELDVLSCPGDTIKETLEYKGWSNETFLMELKKHYDSNQYFWTMEGIENLLAGKLHIDELIAQDLEKVLNVDKQFWLNRERLYREKLAALDPTPEEIEKEIKKQEANEQLAQLIVKCLKGTITADEEAVLQKLRDENAANESFFEKWTNPEYLLIALRAHLKIDTAAEFKKTKVGQAMQNMSDENA